MRRRIAQEILDRDSLAVSRPDVLRRIETNVRAGQYGLQATADIAHLLRLLR